MVYGESNHSNLQTAPHRAGIGLDSPLVPACAGVGDEVKPMAKGLTARKALAEARRRWGKAGATSFRADNHPNCRYSVGRVVMGLMFEVLGQGATWQAAFDAADSRDARLAEAGRRAQAGAL
jgi:hypothetical protein